jgi:NADH-quinone oxidoreductase subunit E
MSGSENAIEWVKNILKVNLNETTPDSLFTIEESECLGRCGKAPSMMINRDFYGELTMEKMEQIINELRKAK